MHLRTVLRLRTDLFVRPLRLGSREVRMLPGLAAARCCAHEDREDLGSVRVAFVRKELDLEVRAVSVALSRMQQWQLV